MVPREFRVIRVVPSGSLIEAGPILGVKNWWQRAIERPLVPPKKHENVEAKYKCPFLHRRATLEHQNKRRLPTVLPTVSAV